MAIRNFLALLIFPFVSACAVSEIASGNGQWEPLFFTPVAARDLVLADDAVIYATSQGLFRSGNGVGHSGDGVGHSGSGAGHSGNGAGHSGDFVKFRRPAVDLPGDPEIINIALAPGVGDIYAVSDLGYLLRSDDRGQSFKMIGQFPNTRITAMSLTTAGRLFVASSSGVLISNQDLSGMPARRARTYMMPWELLILELPIWRRAALAADTDLWKDWSIVLEGNITRLEADPANPDHLIADIFQKGAFQTWDEGATWAAITTSAGISETVHGPVAFEYPVSPDDPLHGSDTRIMIGIFLSTDGGRTWRRTELKPDPEDPSQSAGSESTEFAAASVAVGRTGLWALNYRAGRIYRSLDGAQWHLAGTREDFKARNKETGPALLAADAQGTIWVATDGHGLYKFVEK